MRINYFAVIVGIGVLHSISLFSQSGTEKLIGSEGLNIIRTVVPFLNIAPDSRGSALGDAGAASSPDVNSMHWNPSKYAFVEEPVGLAVSYSPWLRSLVPDMNIAYLTGYKKFNNKQTIAASIKYFSLGEIIFTDEFGKFNGQFTPNEFTLESAYSRLFSDHFSGGIAFRFIRSDLTGGAVANQNNVSEPGISFATDVSSYYRTNVNIEGKKNELAFGINISNIGSKLSYSKNKDEEYFIPTNLRLGSRLTHPIDAYNSISLMIDFNKLLVPTPPLLDTAVGDNDEKKILLGEDSNVPVLQGMIQSFYDAPGGTDEELREIMYSLGIEYWYRNQFAFRGGYFGEHETKGNRKYFTLGMGVRFKVFNLDFSYLVPTVGRNNPLANTLRFTLAFNIGEGTQSNTGAKPSER